jgi:hypothetical protein
VSCTEDGIALRGLFIIDKEGVVQHATINNLAFGRSVDETLRTLQVRVVCAVNTSCSIARFVQPFNGSEPVSLLQSPVAVDQQQDLQRLWILCGTVLMMHPGLPTWRPTG